MSRLALNTRMLSRCWGSWMVGSPAVAPMATMIAVPFSHGVRHVSTTRPKKAQAMKDSLKETAAAVPIAKPAKASTTTKTKKPSTKATAATAAAAAAAAAAEKGVKTTTQAKKTEATKTKAVRTKATPSTAAEPKPRPAAKTVSVAKSAPAPAPASAPKLTANASIPPRPKVQSSEPALPSTPANKKQATTAESGRFATSQQHAAPKAASTEAPTSSRPNPASIPPSRPIQNRPSDKPKPKVDTSSPEYKRAAWKWTSTMIALPILLVTSYFLFDRLALGNEPSLEQIREKIRGVTAAGETERPASEGAVQTTNAA